MTATREGTRKRGTSRGWNCNTIAHATGSCSVSWDLIYVVLDSDTTVAAALGGNRDSHADSHANRQPSPGSDEYRAVVVVPDTKPTTSDTNRRHYPDSKSAEV